MTQPTKEELTAARDALQSGRLTHDDELVINSLLDNAINALDLDDVGVYLLENTKAKPDDEFMRIVATVIIEAIDHLAPRIIRDGMVVVKAGVNDRAVKLLNKGTPFFVVKADEPYANLVVDLIKKAEGSNWTSSDQDWADKAMIAASRGG